MLAARAHSRGVAQQKLLAFAFVKNVDRIARRARQLTYDRALAMQDGVNERRFSSVRPTHDGQRERRLVFRWREVFGEGFRRKKVVNLFEQLSDAASMRGTDPNRVAKAEAGEFHFEIFVVR